MIVVDASAVADALLDAGGRGQWARALLAGDERLAAPHLLDTEVVSLLRSHVLRRDLPRARAERALGILVELRIQRYPVTRLVPRIWTLGDALSAYDATYVALAEALRCPLATTDVRLARAPDLPVDIRTP